ncbi:ATP-dependent Clp protease proteolytic subunit [Reyranella soli]|uniref:ATP-dependent Clp protease proteolytic subunit n=1 Tax=Reyranella soli TaxID=1230389 RepID=A0A512NQ19_9HYPH|nr:ATP-dependent Clp protease proteolytic subunit [Reyranella soli]GEP61043.1 hypothetical protein RSO01_82090 [Reyranella soli]
MRPPGIGVLSVEIGEITRDLAATIENALADYPSHSVSLNVDSVGGDWNASRRIFEAIVAHDKRVSAQIAKAYSGAALIVMAADRRVMPPHGTFFLHWPAGDTTQAYLADVAAKKAELIASRCRVPTTRLLRLMRENSLLDAEQALHYGLVHAVPGMKSPSNVTVFL